MPGPCYDWATELDDVWNEHGFVETSNLATREVRLCFHHSNQEVHSEILERANSSYVQRHVMDKERQYRNLFAQCSSSGSVRDPFQARTLVLLEARVRKYVVERKFQRTSRKMIYCRIADG